jgi:hypothetical protein
MYVPDGCWVAGCCSRLSVCRRGLVVLVESPVAAPRSPSRRSNVVSLQPFTAALHGRMEENMRSLEPSVARESRFQKAKRSDVQYTINSPAQTTWMCFGWAEGRVVRGPQGPPCSSASALRVYAHTTGWPGWIDSQTLVGAGHNTATFFFLK